ncbi:MAG: beta strand repeat-containing protein, partial [Actinomycetota bacterium]
MSALVGRRVRAGRAVGVSLGVLVALVTSLFTPASAQLTGRTFTFVPITGSWNLASNWDDISTPELDGQVPGPDDTAFIGPARNVTITSTPPNPGSVSINPGFNTGGIRIDVDPGASLTVEHSMDIEGAGGLQFFGPGSIGFASGATLGIELGPVAEPGLWGQLQLFEDMTFTVPGGPGSATTWTAGNFVLQGGGPTRLVVPDGATFPLLDGASIGASTVSEQLVNHGTITKSGPGTTQVNPRLLNTGTVSATGGTLNFGAGPPDGESHTGAFSASAGAHLRLLGGAHHLADGASIVGAGTITYTGGTIAAGAAIPVESVLFAGTITFGTGSSLAVSGTLDLVGGSVFDGPGTIDFGESSALSIDMAGGQLGLRGDFDLTLPPGNGTTWTAGSIAMNAGGTDITSLVVPAGATFPLLDGGSIGSNTTSDAVRIVNNGTITKSGSLVTTLNPIFFNNGDVNVQAGTLRAPTTRQNSGEIDIAAGAILNANVFMDGGVLAGRGSVTDAVQNDGGTVAPGGANARGALSIGSYAQGPGGTLEVDIAGTALGTGDPDGYDRLAVTNGATLDGTLAIANAPSFTPQLGDVVTVLTRGSGSGTFATVTGATTPGGTFEPTYTATQVDLTFESNDVIIDLLTSQGFLDALTNVPGSVLMVNVDGRDFLVIPNLTDVGVDATITDNDDLLVVDLSALAAVGGNIDISGNLVMTTLDLSSLTDVTGDLLVTGNPNVTAVHISGVGSIGGDLSLIGTAATSIDLPALTEVGGAVDISGNTAATGIDLSALTSAGDSVDISGNTAATGIDL